MSFESWYRNNKFSDTKVCVRVYKDVTTPNIKSSRRRRRYFKPEPEVQSNTELVEEFPAHKVVLGRASKWFEKQLESNAAFAEILVTDIEVSAADHLVQYIYSEKVPEDLDNLELMKLLKLADQFQVPGCIRDVVNQLIAMDDVVWTLDRMQALTQLVEALSSAENTTLLRQRSIYLVRSRFQQFEIAWRSDALRTFFCQLPQIFVENLLIWDELKVFSENMVATALHYWLDCQPAAIQQHAAADLAQFLRLPHCTASYLAGILPNLRTLCSCPDLSTRIADITALQMVPEKVRSEFIGRLSGPEKPLWSPRTKLAALPYAFTTQFTFQQFAEVQRRLVEESKEEEMISGEPHWLNGLQFMLNVTVRAASNSQYGVLWAGVGFRLDGMQNPAMFTRFVFELKVSGDEKPLLANAYANITSNRSWGVNLFADLPQQSGDTPLTFVTTIKELY